MSIKERVKQTLGVLGIEIHRRPGAFRRSRRSDRLTFWKGTATGDYYLPTDARGDDIANTIIGNQVFDPQIFECAKRYIRPGTTSLDVGSNFGQMAVLMSRLVGPDGRVYAFEADDFVFTVLEKNAAANASNITPVFGAVHNIGGETLYFPEQDFQRFQTYGSYGIDYRNRRGRPVPTVAIDDIEFTQPVSFMKVDVQGGDLMAMEGAVKTIRSHRMPIVFEYEYLFEEELDLSFQAYVDFVQSIDYRFAKVIYGQNFLILPREAEARRGLA